MKKLRKENLPETVVRSLNLDDMAEVFLDDNGNYAAENNQQGEKQRFEFVGVDLVNISYAAVVKKGDHYLVRDDPYHTERGEVNGIRRTFGKPLQATHYCLGPIEGYEKVSTGEKKQGTEEEFLSIAYLKLIS